MDSFRAVVKKGLASVPSEPGASTPEPEPAPTPPASEPAVPSAPEYEVYTVAKGDTLWRIAANKLGSGSRYPEIKALNALPSDTIYAGQKLRIPRR